MFEIKLAKRLKTLRENKNLTQEKVASYLGVSRSAYTYYETGKTEPNLQAIFKLSKLYDMSVDELIAEKNR